MDLKLKRVSNGQNFQQERQGLSKSFNTLCSSQNKAKFNNVPDALSRLPMKTEEEGEMSEEPIIGINRIFIGTDG